MLARIILVSSVLVAACQNDDTRAASTVTFETSVASSADTCTFLDIKELPTGHHLVESHVNDRTAWFILDSGAGMSVIDDAHASAYGLNDASSLRREDSAGLGGPIELTYHATDRFNLGTIDTGVVEIVTADLNGALQTFSRRYDVEIEGIVGQDVLSALNAVIDVGARRVLVRRHVSDHDDGFFDCMSAQRNDYTVIPLGKVETGHNTVDVAINGGAGIFVVDSGSLATFINRNDLPKFSVQAGQNNEQDNQVFGAGGNEAVERHTVGQFSIGGFSIEADVLQSVDLAAVEALIFEKSGVDMDGIVGQDILSDLDAYIDVSGQGLYLRRD